MPDAYLPQRLVDMLMYMQNYMGMAKVAGVPMSFLPGLSVKVFFQVLREAQVLRKAQQRNLVVPNLTVSHD